MLFIYIYLETAYCFMRHFEIALVVKGKAFFKMLLLEGAEIIFEKSMFYKYNIMWFYKINVTFF